MRFRTVLRMWCVGATLLAACASLSAGTIGLQWDSSANASGYRVYWGPSSGNLPSSQDVGNNTTATINGLQNCIPTFFAVTAYNGSGESGRSNEISNWPRPEVGSTSPPRAMQGAQLTLNINGNNFQSGAAIQIDNPNVFLSPASVQACNRIQASATVEPMADGVRPAETGLFSMTVTNPDQLEGTGAGVFEVLVNPERFDIVDAPGPSQGRLDGRDTIMLARLFGSREGGSLYDPDLDFNGDGWIDGQDLSFLAGNLGLCWTGSAWSASACP